MGRDHALKCAAMTQAPLRGVVTQCLHNLLYNSVAMCSFSTICWFTATFMTKQKVYPVMSLAKPTAMWASIFMSTGLKLLLLCLCCHFASKHWDKFLPCVNLALKDDLMTPGYIYPSYCLWKFMLRDCEWWIYIVLHKYHVKEPELWCLSSLQTLAWSRPSGWPAEWIVDDISIKQCFLVAFVTLIL